MIFFKKYIVIIIILLGLVAGFVYKNKSKNNNIETNSNATTTVISNSDGYTVEQLPSGSADVKIPDLNRKVIFGNGVNFEENVKKLVTEKIIGLQTELKKDSKNLSNWINLGTYLKMTGDYEGASISWKYVSEVSSDDFVALGNLGDLYGYYLKDKSTSESYYKKAIAKGPTQIYLYIQLSNLYKDIFKDLSKANAIIDEGLKKNPSNNDLLQFKASLK